MKIIIPMSGTGQRFIEARYKEPKPLIEVDGKPIIEHVVNMFPGETDFVFICNREHLEKTNLKAVLKKIAPNSQIVAIEPHKLGPVHTVLQAEQLIADDEPIIVSYCDFTVGWDYQDFKKTIKANGCAAAATAYKDFHPHLLGPGLYASMRVDKDNWMLECREKHSFTENKMDSYQQAGSFYFAKGKILKDCFHEVEERDLKINNEYYVSVATQVLMENGQRVYVYPLKYFCQWGTPADLEEYKGWAALCHKVARQELRKEDLHLDTKEKSQSFAYWCDYFRDHRRDER